MKNIIQRVKLYPIRLSVPIYFNFEKEKLCVFILFVFYLFIYSLIYLSIYSFSNLVMSSFIYFFIYLFIHLFIHLLFHLFISYLFVYLLIHLLISTRTLFEKKIRILREDLSMVCFSILYPLENDLPRGYLYPE